MKPSYCIQPVTEAEVAVALRHLKNGHSPVVCSIIAELLKAGGASLTHCLVYIINEVWIREELPDDWRCSVILPFWKYKGGKLIYSNHQGITLLSITGKFPSSILLTWTLPAVCHKCRPQQAGFIPNHSTVDYISVVRHIVEKQWEFQKDQHLCIAFINLKAAFESLDYHTLWTILRTIHVPEKIIPLFSKVMTRLSAVSGSMASRQNGSLSKLGQSRAVWHPQTSLTV